MRPATERHTTDPGSIPTARSAAQMSVAIMAIASSAVLVRWADAPAVALAFWRTLGGALILSVGIRRGPRNPPLDRGTVLAVVGAGLALAVHFAGWLASLEMTSVAASVTLVSTAPIFVALLSWMGGGDRPTTRDWLVIALTFVGAGIITGSGLGSGDDQLAGNALALLGAVAMAVYLVLGAKARSALSTTGYAARAYAVAAAGLLPVAVIAGVPLWGYDPQTWLVIGAMILGPQLAGHTMLNLLLDRLGSLTVSLGLLAEPIGASLLGWLFLGEIPPIGAWIGAPIVIGGLALHLLGTRGSDHGTSRSAASTR